MDNSQGDIRGIPLLEGEEVWLTLHTRSGMVKEVPSQDDCVVLTSQRLLGFWREEARRRRVLVPLQNIDAVEVTHPARSLRPLLTGVALALAGLLVVWLAAAFGMTGVLSWLIAGTLVVLGAVTGSPYFVAEDPSTIAFRSRTSEVALPLRTPEALRDAYLLANGFFQARVGKTPTPSPEPSLAQIEAPPLWQQAEPLAGSTALSAETPIQSQELPQPQGRQDV